MPPVPPAVVEFAKSRGYKSVEPSGKWNGYNVFYLVTKVKGFTGLPSYVLQKGDEIRINTADETDDIMFKREI